MTIEQAPIEPVTSAAVTPEVVEGLHEGEWDDLTALQKIALAEGNDPAPRPLSQSERESAVGSNSTAVNGEPSPLQRIAALEAESKKDREPQPVVQEAPTPEPTPVVEPEVVEEKPAEHKNEHKSAKPNK